MIRLRSQATNKTLSRKAGKFSQAWREFYLLLCHV